MKTINRRSAAVLLCLLGGAQAAAQEPRSSEKLARTLYASFDKGFDADVATGDKRCYLKQGKELVPMAANEEVQHVAEGGVSGGCLKFTKKGKTWPLFKGQDVLGYNRQDWNATISVWLKLDPDKDLEPGYCDPVQIVGDDSKKGFIFMEWSKDETPRLFRYAIRPLLHIWNPNNLQWADIPVDKRPMVQVEKAPFSRDRWTHLAFTIEHVNSKEKANSGSLYIDGKKQGSINNWDLSIDWDPTQVQLVLGAAYVGMLDELSVYQGVLSAEEINNLSKLPALAEPSK